MSDGDVRGYKILAAAIIIRAMKDSAGKNTSSTHSRSAHTLEGIRKGADRWLRQSVQCAVYLDWLDWECSGSELAELAKNGVRWNKVAHTISHLLVA